MENLTLETLPQAFSILTNEVSEIKKLLLERHKDSCTDTDHWFNLTEFCLYHPDKPSKATVYSWINSRLVPVHKSGKKLRFLKSEIDEWLKGGKKRTIHEIETEANKLKTKHRK